MKASGILIFILIVNNLMNLHKVQKFIVIVLTAYVQNPVFKNYHY